MEQSDLIVRRIKDGTVIDHINEGKDPERSALEAIDTWKRINKIS